MTALIAPRGVDEEFRRIVDALTRRGFLAGGLGAAAVLGLAACGSDDGASGASDGVGPWSFTDDLGTTVDLPRAPRRIVSTDDLVTVALMKAGVDIKATPLLPSGIFSALDLPHDGIVSIANEANEFNTEKAASASPDLVVDFIQDGKAAVTTTNPQLAELAPVVALQVNDATVETVIERARRFAAAVRGAAEEAPDLAAQKAYAAAVAGLTDVARSTTGLRAAIVLPVKAQLYVARPRNTPYLQTLAEAGVAFVPDQGGASDYFQSVSWESVADLPADVLIPITDVQDPNPAWSHMPAVKAGQVFAQNPVRWSGYYYENYASLLSDFAAFLRGADVVAPR